MLQNLEELALMGLATEIVCHDTSAIFSNIYTRIETLQIKFSDTQYFHWRLSLLPLAPQIHS